MPYDYREIEPPCVVKTRKPHICGWCAKRIDKGTMSPFRKYFFDGELHNEWMHPECHEAMQKVDPYELSEGWTPGDYARGSTTDEEISALPIEGE